MQLIYDLFTNKAMPEWFLENFKKVLHEKKYKNYSPKEIVDISLECEWSSLTINATVEG